MRGRSTISSDGRGPVADTSGVDHAHEAEIARTDLDPARLAARGAVPEMKGGHAAKVKSRRATSPAAPARARRRKNRFHGGPATPDRPMLPAARSGEAPRPPRSR